MTKLKFFLLSCLIALAFVACRPGQSGNDETRPYPPELRLPYDGNQHHLIVAASTPAGVRVKGFQGAVRPNANIRVRASGTEHSSSADVLGRFDLVLPFPNEFSHPEQIELSISVRGTNFFPESTWTYRVRKLDLAFHAMLGTQVKTKSTPNDILFLPNRSTPQVLVTASESAVVEQLQLDAPFEPPISAIYFSPKGKFTAEQASNPHSTVLLGSGNVAVTTLWGHHTLSHFALGEKKPRDTYRLEDAAGKPLQFELAAPINPRKKVYFTGGASPDAMVSRMPGQHPQRMLFKAPWLLVAYINYIDFAFTPDAPPQAGPGGIGIFHFDGQALRSKGALSLPCQNAIDVIEDDTGKPWALCSGLLGATHAKTYEALTDAELIELAPVMLGSENPFALGRRIKLGRFSPSSVLFVGDKIVVLSSLKPEIALMPYDAPMLLDSHVVRLATVVANGGLGRAIEYGGGLVFMTAFGANQVIVVDVGTGEINPWPFLHGIPMPVIDAETTLGPGAIAKRPGQPGLDHDSNDIAVLLDKGPSVVPLSMLRLMGP